MRPLTPAIILLALAACTPTVPEFEVLDDTDNAWDEPSVEDPSQDDPTSDDPVDDPTRENPAQDDPVEDDPVEDDPVEDDPVEDDPVEDDPVEDDPVEDDPVEDDPVEDDPVEDDPVEDDPVDDPLDTGIAPTDTGCATFYLFADSDSDGFGDKNERIETCFASAGYVTNDTDCDDKDATRFPNNEEACDAVDNDCNGEVDDNAPPDKTWYRDADGDAAGVYDETVSSCLQPSGYTASFGDCDDADSERGFAPVWYADADGDGAGSVAGGEISCDAPEGHVADSMDCDDQDPNNYPGNAEVCDGADNNCDTVADGPDSEDAFERWWDADGDGYGTYNVSIYSCYEFDGYVDNAADCDDANDTINPDGSEVCDGLDNDCNGLWDDEASGTSTFYADRDGDGYGNPADEVQACYVDFGRTALVDATDCDDTDYSRSPDTWWWRDADGDGHGSMEEWLVQCDAPEGYTSLVDDCDDSDASVSPSADELCNELDDNCNGFTDDSPVDGDTYYVDNDGDGYGNDDLVVKSCVASEWLGTVGGDCDDSRSWSFPGAEEACDSVDNNCDGVVDGPEAWVVPGAQARIFLEPEATGSVAIEFDLAAELDELGITGVINHEGMMVTPQSCNAGQWMTTWQYVDSFVGIVDGKADDRNNNKGTLLFTATPDYQNGTFDGTDGEALEPQRYAVYFSVNEEPMGSPGWTIPGGYFESNNGQIRATFDGNSGGMLSNLISFDPTAFEAQISQTWAAGGNGVHTEKGWLSATEGTSDMTVLASGPFVTAYEASGNRENESGSYDYTYTFWLLQQDPTLWTTVSYVATSDITLEPSSAAPLVPWQHSAWSNVAPVGEEIEPVNFDAWFGIGQSFQVDVTAVGDDDVAVSTPLAGPVVASGTVMVDSLVGALTVGEAPALPSYTSALVGPVELRASDTP